MMLRSGRLWSGRRVVGIPSVILPARTEHLAAFSAPGPDGLVFPGPKGGPLRRGNFNRQAAWPQAIAAIGVKGLHFHDLRHSGNA
jgi:integrase